jgi:hypothetical protein
LDHVEKEAGKGAARTLIVVIRANVASLERLRDDAEAFGVVNKVLLETFLQESEKLFSLYPVLREIDDPYESNVLPDSAIERGEQFVEAFYDAISTAEAEEVIGPSVPSVTRDLMIYPWPSPKSRIIGFATFARQVKSAPESPPIWVSGSSKYADFVTKVSAAFAIIVAVFHYLV